VIVLRVGKELTVLFGPVHRVVLGAILPVVKTKRMVTLSVQIAAIVIQGVVCVNVIHYLKEMLVRE